MANPDLQKLAKDLSKCVKSKPYNPFAAWKMSENDHTKYLLSILRYHDAHGNYPVLADFLSRFTDGKGSMNNYTNPKNVRIEFSHKIPLGEFNKQGFIDGLITFDDNNEKVGIIIENKIHGACDQTNQVRNYISHLRNQNDIKLENIWVLYITSDGIKVVSKESYKKENEAEKTNIGNRFIEINYKEDITEWLQNDILNNGYYPESLTSIVRTYFNYLRNDLFCDYLDINLQNKFLEEFDIPTNLNELKPGDWEKLISLRNNVGINDADASIDTTILDGVLSSIFERITVLAFDKFERISIEILNKHWAKELKENDVTWQASHHSILGNGYLQFRLVNERGSAHIEWIPISVRSMLFDTEYTITLHCEGTRNQKLQQDWKEKLKSNLPTDSKIKIKGRGCSLKVESKKSLASMSESELDAFLTELYTKTFEYPISLLVHDFNVYKDKGSEVKELEA